MGFFDPQLYESMRQIIVDSTTATADEFEALSLTFQVSMRDEMGGKIVELLPNGAEKDVTPDNVYQYVELHAQHVMVEAMRPELEAIRHGLYVSPRQCRRRRCRGCCCILSHTGDASPTDEHNLNLSTAQDVVPESALSGLTAEDFRLLLNGCSAIDVRMLKSCTTFVNETGRASAQEAVEDIKKWFWQIVEKMSDAQRHDLVYFWTSSPGLPATEAGFVPKPSIVIRPPSDTHLPTANTCVARLSIPLYTSRKVCC